MSYRNLFLSIENEGKSKGSFHEELCIFFSYMGSFAGCVTKTAKKCGPEHQKIASNIINNYAADLLSTVCVKWKSASKACKELPKISPAENPKYKSLIAPLADVLVSLNRR